FNVLASGIAQVGGTSCRLVFPNRGDLRTIPDRPTRSRRGVGGRWSSATDRGRIRAMNARVAGALIVAAWMGAGSSAVLAQAVFERDTKITGPAGRSVERQVRSERGPGFVERDVRIQRPAGTFERDLRIQNGPGGVQRSMQVTRNLGGGFAGPGPRVVQNNMFVNRPTRFIERDVIVRGGGGPGWGTALGIGGGVVW